MKLIDLLKLIEGDLFPLISDAWGINSIPQSIFTVTLCFMSENNTWVTVNIENEILIPWYDCEISSITGSEKDNDILVWLKDKRYIKSNWEGYVEWCEADENIGKDDDDECNMYSTE